MTPTILTLEELPAMPDPEIGWDSEGFQIIVYTSEHMLAHADAREFAVLKKLAGQAMPEPVGEVCLLDIDPCGGIQWYVRQGEPLPIGTKLYTSPIPPTTQEPMYWVRLRSDGGHEGPLHNDNIEDVRKKSGAWTPLYAGQVPDAKAEIEPNVDVRSILLDIVPGSDGMGLEVYAKTVDDVEDKLTELAERLEAATAAQQAVGEVVESSEPCANSSSDAILYERRPVGTKLYAGPLPATAAQGGESERDALQGWINTIKAAHDECLDDAHPSSRSMLRELISEMESALAKKGGAV